MRLTGRPTGSPFCFIVYNLFMLERVSLQPVDYLILGHITQDITPEGSRLGGTATFSALTAHNLGLRVGVVTALAENTDLTPLNGITVIRTASDYTTTFENIYDEDGRKQVLHHQAAKISFDNVPEAWRAAPIVHLGPVAQELDTGVQTHLSPSLLGITPQGWMRTWNSEGRVSPTKWKNAGDLLPKAGAMVVSREDVGGDEELIESMAHQTRVLAVTEGAAGSVLYWNGDRRRFRAPQVRLVDATGAGDIFATALFHRLYTTRDPWEAARFATQLSARSVTRSGLAGVPTRREIEECLVEVF